MDGCSVRCTATTLATQGDGDQGRRRDPRVSIPDELRRLSAESRVRLAAVTALREQHRLIAEQSQRRLDASRLLLERRSRERV
jgi:hypothetical protein